MPDTSVLIEKATKFIKQLEINSKEELDEYIVLANKIELAALRREQRLKLEFELKRKEEDECERQKQQQLDADKSKGVPAVRTVYDIML